MNIQQVAAGAVQARQRISNIIFQTPLLPSQTIGKEAGCNLAFKAENFQRTGSFKIRGAASKMTSLAVDQPVITASSGNHGIGAAMAASLIGQKLTVVLPEIVTPAKLARIRSYGIEVVLHGTETGLAELHAQNMAAERGLVYVSPYNDPEIIAGQGTIALELLEQMPEVDNVFVAMGGGGLISGIGSVLKSFRPSARIYGVSARNSGALAAAIAAGQVVDVDHQDTLADAVAGGIDADTITLPLARAVIDDVLVCDEAEIERALRLLAWKERQLVEGAAALALAGLLKVAQRVQNQNNVVLLCGGNFDRERILPLLAR